MKYSYLYLCFVLITPSLHADVQLPSVIGDHMVIGRPDGTRGIVDVPAQLWRDLNVSSIPR